MESAIMLIENLEDSETEQDEMRISKPISAYFLGNFFNRKSVTRQRRSEMIFAFYPAKFSTILSCMLLLNLPKTFRLIPYKIIILGQY
jgi:hypothetical protein